MAIWLHALMTTILALAPVGLMVMEKGIWRADDQQLPEELTEPEARSIRKETSPKGHVEATLKVSDSRLVSALSSSQQSQYQTASQHLTVYFSLIRYADQYSRALPAARRKDREFCLKKLEQAIFKQNPRLEAVTRELPFDYREASDRGIEEVKKIRLSAINDLLGGGRAFKPPEN